MESTTPPPPPLNLPYQPGQPRQGMRTSYVAMLTGLVLATGLFFGCIAGVSIATPDEKPDLASTPSWTAGLGSLPATPSASASATLSTPTPPPPVVAVTIMDGTWQVPTDVKPGRYRTVVPADSSNCYWARLKGFSGSTEEINANGNASSGTSAIVTIKPTDKGFESSGCGTWTKIG